MGLVLYASFSIHEDPNIVVNNLVSGKPYFLYCQCLTSMANTCDETISFSTSIAEITWVINNLGEFILISYIPGEPFKIMLQHRSNMKASFVSDWIGVIVQKHALHLLYQHDQVQFEQELIHCNNMILEQQEIICKQFWDINVNKIIKKIVTFCYVFAIKYMNSLFDAFHLIGLMNFKFNNFFF